MKTSRLFVLCFGLVAIFAGCQPDIADGDIDLDTTYFPFGLGYEWCYERHDSGHIDWGEEPESWETTDTSIYSVTDSIFDEDTLLISTSGSLLMITNPVKIFKDSVLMTWDVVGMGSDSGMIPIYPQPISDGWKYISYQEDTLIIDFDGSSPLGGEYLGTRTTRLEGIGAISESRYYEDNDYGWNSIAFRLLWFYNGQDTVYDASQSEAFRSSAKSCTARYRTSRQD